MPGMLYARSIRINDYIEIRIPTVGEMLDYEEQINDIICSVVSTPYELMVQLDDVGIDFTTVSSFDVFGMLFKRLQETDVSIVFGSTDFSGYRYAIDERTNLPMWVDEATDHRIDACVHEKMADTLRGLFNIAKNDKTPGNEDAKQYMIKRARAKMKSRLRKKQSETSQMESLIVALVNSKEFKYDYDSVRNITIYQFYASLKQISHRIKFDNTMTGYYSGSIKFDDIPADDRSWIAPNKK